MKKILSLALAAIIVSGSLFTIQPAKKSIAAGEGPECWAVIVGITDYQSGDDTWYAAKGAAELYEILEPCWGSDNIRLLLDRDAKKADIISAIEWLAEVAEPDDTTLFYFAGHGTREGYLAAWDAYFLQTFITTNELKNSLSAIPSEHQAVILDCCHSGRHSTSLDIQGFVSLFSSLPNQTSWEYGSMENLVFTHYILRGLSRFDDADTNDDQQLSAEELFAYAEGPTISVTKPNEVQNPVLTDAYEGDLGLLEQLVLDTNYTLPSTPGILIIDETQYDAIPVSLVNGPGFSSDVTVTQTVQKNQGTRYVFSSWNDGVTTTSRSVTRGEYTARYDIEYLVKVSSLYGDPITGGWYRNGSKVTISVPELVEEPGIKHIFTGWEGDFTSDSPEAEISVTKQITTSANWRNEFLLTVVSEYGTPDGEGWYRENETASITVEPLIIEPGTRHHFDGWTGSVTTDSPTASIAMNQPADVTAEWWNEHLVTLESEYGTIEGNGWYTEGDTATISSTEIEGFIIRHVFDGWDGDIADPASTASFNVDGPKTIVATWKTDFVQLYMLVGGIVLIGIILFVVIKLRARA